jgi:23S rRNA (pseudouridine1915-N3)-methyltransferase
MKIHLITCGNLDEFQRKIFDEYILRITLFDIFLKEINIKGDLEKNIRIEKESCEILKKMKSLNDDSNFKSSKNKIILLDILGQNYSSEDFSGKIIKDSMENPIIKNLIFIIGGAFGVNEGVKFLADKKLSFGLNTWPHNLMKIMLIEQIFRSQTIFLGKNYHH